MKRYMGLLCILVVMISFSACAGREKTAQERIKPVKTIEVTEQESPAVLSYSGMVGPGELKELAFKSTARIAKIHVEKGQRVKKGDVLVELESQDLQYALAAARGQMGSAQAAYDKAVNGASPEELRNAELNVKKAGDAYEYISNNYKRIEALYESGAASKNELEQAKLEMDTRESELRQAEEVLAQLRNGARSEDRKALAEQLEQAKADYEYKAALVQDAVMTADTEGYVVDILYEKGELVPAGYPVAVVRNEELVVSVGLSEKDLDRIALGTRAMVYAGEKAAAGTVTSISQVPDTGTMTYNTEISLEKCSFSIGTVAKVELTAGNERGIWVPLTSILSDGTDYVFLARDNTAEKREIVIDSVRGTMAKVDGLKTGERLVVEGMKRLRAGDRITVLE